MVNPNTLNGEDILQEAINAHNAVKDLEYPAEIRPTQGWSEIVNHVLYRGISECSNATEAIHYIQRQPQFSIPNTPKESLRMIKSYIKWLNSIGKQLSDYPANIQESPFANPSIITEYDNRKVSTMFLWYLCICEQIFSNIKDPITKILEIGGGFGPLARLIKLLNPNSCYFILDLPESLFFNYIFIRTNFPEAKVIFVTEVQDLNEYYGYDFVFMPAPFVDKLKGLSVDLTINTSSLGEMTQSAVTRYMKLIQQEIQTKYFYSLNRYGRFPVNISRISRSMINNFRKIIRGRSQYTSQTIIKYVFRLIKHKGLNFFIDFPPREFVSEDGCSCAVTLDPYWKIHFWNLPEDKTFIETELGNPAYLEILAERIPEFKMHKADFKNLSQAMFDEACKKFQYGREWHYLIWEAVRLNNTQENLGPYLHFLEKNKYLEVDYYERIYKALNNNS